MAHIETVCRGRDLKPGVPAGVDLQAAMAIRHINEKIRKQLSFKSEFEVWLRDRRGGPNIIAIVLDKSEIVRDVVATAYRRAGWSTIVFYRQSSVVYLKRETDGEFSLPSA